MSAETAAILRRARERISDPARWCKRVLARNAKGRALRRADSLAACAWCAEGAAWREGGPDAFGRVVAALAAQVPRGLGQLLGEGPGAVAVFNDRRSTTHADILALFDRAIAAEEASP